MAWIRKFFQYSEIRTKITSVSVFALCIAYFLMRHLELRWLPTIIFFAGMLVFDLTTTTINNYIDSKTDDTVLPFSRRGALALSIVLLLVACALGVWLVLLSDLFVLILGGCCFVCGVFYTFGPVPISRLPFGEVLSGLFYGFFIPWIFFYINLPAAEFMQWQWQLPHAGVLIHVLNFAGLILLAVAPFCCTANIMLANNICDTEKDLLQGRRTLPSHIGRKNSLLLFAALALLPYLSLPVLVLAGLARPIVLLACLTLIPVVINVRSFYQKQDKRETFSLSLKNYLLTVLSFGVFMIPGIWI
jgi:1,4-dihydroxy-2-naphthoate polyprenyltransferase